MDLNQNKIKWNLIDGIFIGSQSIVAGKIPTFIEWDRSLSDLTRPTFYSHGDMFGDIKTPYEQSYGLLFESYGIVPNYYKQIKKFEDRFKYIFTYHPRLLSENPDKYKFIPAYGIWIGGTHDAGKIEITAKTKLLSIIASDKRWTPLQEWRQQCAQFIKRENLGDSYGKSVDNPVASTYEGLAPYMFSIVSENIAIDNYFTEKILNCFAVGTIPVYIGCRNINQFFNSDGIIYPPINCKSQEEFKTFLQILTPDLYESKKSAIIDNYNKCLEFEIVEDYLYKNYNAIL